MTESQARCVLLVRAFEMPVTAPWSDDQADWATREALRLEGEHARDEPLLLRRAALAGARLAQHDPQVAAALAAPGVRAWMAWLAVLVPFAAGVAGDAVGAGQRINVIAPPLLALMLWNVCVYLALVVSAARSGTSVVPGALRDALVRWRARWAAGVSSLPALARFRVAWAAASRELQLARVAALLHLAAAALACGAIASLYLRGLALEYRAGWDSTFLDAQQVRHLLGWLLGPAALLGGPPLPGVDEVAAMRFANGPGENAARWIHLYAITLALWIVVPRLLLAGAAAWQVRRRSSRFAVDLGDAYFRRLAAAHAATPVAVHVRPYAHAGAAQRAEALRAVLEQQIGAPVNVDLAPVVPMDDEAPLAPTQPRAGPSWTVVLFPLTATPEREHHGAFVRQVAQSLPPSEHLLVLIDEAEFRQRFTPARTEERRQAWRRMLRDEGHEARFADLAHPGTQDAAA